jgi:polar amino acid transport system substrate-binding protein
MKKTIFTSLTFLLVVVLASCSGSSSESKPTKQDNGLDLVKAGDLTICSDIPYPPFEFMNGQVVAGFDADFINYVADEIELSAEFVDTDFKEIFDALDDGKCDVIASAVSITDEREKLHSFSDPYYEISQSILTVNSKANELDGLDKLKDKVVGVQSETTGEALAQENSQAFGFSVTSFSDSDSLFMALKRGDIDVIIQDFPVNAYTSNLTGTTKVTKTFDAVEKYGFVVAKNNNELLRKINSALKSAKEDGTYEEIERKYFGS